MEAEQLYLQREAYIRQMKAAIAFYRQKRKRFAPETGQTAGSSSQQFRGAAFCIHLACN